MVIDDNLESNYGTLNSHKNQGKTPKFGNNQLHYFNTQSKKNQSNSSRDMKDLQMQHESFKLTEEGPCTGFNEQIFSSRSSYQLNEEIFQEYNSNNDEDNKLCFRGTKILGNVK